MPPALSDSPATAHPGGRRLALMGVLGAILIAGPWTGWLHTIELAVERFALDHFVWYSREFIWMSPVAYTLFFAVASVPLLGLAALVPRWIHAGIAAGWVALLATFGLLLPYSQVGRPASLILAIGVGVQVARVMPRHAAFWRRNAPRLVIANAVLVGIIAVLQPIVRKARERAVVASLPAAPADAPNVLLVILDTVRAASLSLYGFPHPTTPHLATWAAQGTTFDWAFAPAPWTLPSHASFLSGKYPFEMGADWDVPFDRQTPVLTELFRDRGYNTAAILGNLDYTAWDSGLQRGFVHVEDYPVSWRQLIHSTSFTQTAMVQDLMGAGDMRHLVRALTSVNLTIEPKHNGGERRASDVTQGFLDWQRAQGERPFFAMLNYFDAHQRYYVPPGFKRLGTPFGDRYHSAIAWIDTNLEQLFADLQSRGVLEKTLVVVVSDHGELFNEHGLNGHANNLYRNVLHVPLVMRLPGRVPAGVRVGRQVSLRDLAATIADLAGLPAGSVPGASLRGAWEGDTTRLSPVMAQVRQAPNVSPTFPTARGDLAALLDDQGHYIRNYGGGEELFAYRRDTLETTDLGTGSPLLLEPFRTRLAQLTGRK